jgi:hypothetical protein
VAPNIEVIAVTFPDIFSSGVFIGSNTAEDFKTLTSSVLC